MVESRSARFREGSVPPGGTCLSTFVIVNSGNRVLVGKPTRPEHWASRFFVSEEMAPKLVENGLYVLPASHLAWFESPEDAAQRVLREMLNLNIPKNRLRLLDVQSHTRGDTPENTHWDLCFVYQAELPAGMEKKIATPEWFSELTLVPKSKLKPEHFSRGHGDVLDLAKGKIKSNARARPARAAKAKRTASRKKSRKR